MESNGAERLPQDSLWLRHQLLGTLPPHEAADVYAARDRETGAAVQVWLLRPGAQDPPGVEALLAGLERARHFSAPGVLALSGFGVQSGRVHAIYPAVEAEPLAALFQRKGRLTEFEAARLVRRALDATEAIVRAGQLHPGLQPRNVLRTRDGAILIAELGLPALSAAAALSGSIPDSAFVRAPEARAGFGADDAAQQYAAAGLAGWLVTGEPPFAGESERALRAQHVGAPPPQLAGASSDADDRFGLALLRALAKRPADRFESGAAFSEAVAEAVENPQPPRWKPAALPPALDEAARGPEEPADPTTGTPDEVGEQTGATAARAPSEDLATAALLLEPAFAELDDTPAFVPKPQPPKERNPWVGRIFLAAVLIGVLLCLGAAISVGLGAREQLASVAAALSTATPPGTRTPTPTGTARPAATSTGIVVVGSPVATATPPNPNDNGSLYEAALACWDRDWPCAIEHLTRIVDREAGFRDAATRLVRAHVALGISLVREARVSTALEQFEKALARAPGDSAATQQRGYAIAFLEAESMYNEQDWANAAERFERVLPEPAYGTARRLAYASRVNDGRRLLAAGEKSAAERSCRRALEHQPNGEEAQNCVNESLGIIPTPSPTPTIGPSPTPGASPTPTGTPTPGASPTPAATATAAPPTATATPRTDCYGGAVSALGDSNNGYVQIRGFVRDRNGSGVAGVRIEADSGGTIIPITTGADGSFVLDSLGRGKYTLRMRAPNGATAAVVVDASRDTGSPVRANVDFREGSC